MNALHALLAAVIIATLPFSLSFSFFLPSVPVETVEPQDEEQQESVGEQMFGHISVPDDFELDLSDWEVMPPVLGARDIAPYLEEHPDIDSSQLAKIEYLVRKYEVGIEFNKNTVSPEVEEGIARAREVVDGVIARRAETGKLEATHELAGEQVFESDAAPGISAEDLAGWDTSHTRILSWEELMDLFSGKQDSEQD